MFACRSAAPIWAIVRSNVYLPELESTDLSEMQLASLIFERNCHLCGRGRAVIVDYALRRRWCKVRELANRARARVLTQRPPQSARRPASAPSAFPRAVPLTLDRADVLVVAASTTCRGRAMPSTTCTPRRSSARSSLTTRPAAATGPRSVGLVPAARLLSTDPGAPPRSLLLPDGCPGHQRSPLRARRGHSSRTARHGQGQTPPQARQARQG